MRRDWNTIRCILLVASDEMDRIECDPEALDYHLDMLRQAGYIRSDEWALTFQGHNLLDAILDDTVWEGCQRAIALNGGGLPTDVLLRVADAARKDITAARAKGEAVTLTYHQSPGFGAKLDWSDMGR